jgi:membrane protein implicated in regulation of membrane protease activity
VAGSVAALITSFFTDNLIIQFVVFAVVSLVLLIATRPLVRKLRGNVKIIPTNADRCIGQSAVVIEDIDDTSGKGQVKVAGNVWSALSSDGSSIEKGRDVTVLEIKGVKLVVKPQA